ncbi:ABC transporter permease [Salmonella enterica subsp. enterica]|nr:ABC transporter permease [Salmonella enterica subsp. enterica]
MSEAMMWLLVRGVWETLAMTFVSGFFGFVIGLPVGVLLYVTRPGQIMENARLYRSLSAVVNIFPLDSLYHPAGVDDSFYPNNCRHLHWFAGCNCTADRRRRAFYRPYGGKCVVRDPCRAD